MPTFVKTGYWDKLSKAPKGFLNLEELIASYVGSGLPGEVAIWGTSGLGGSSNLVWDSVNNRLGIGTTAPIGKLDIVSDGGGQMFFTRYGGQPQINIRRSQGTFAAPTAVVSGASSVLNFGNYNGTAFATSAQIQVVPITQTLTDAGATMALNVVRNGTTTMTNGLLVSGNNTTAGCISISTAFNAPSSRLTIWGSTINTTLDYFDIVNTGGGQLLRFFNTGNLVVGGSPDAGQRLQVYGDVFIKGSGATSATNALVVQNSTGLNQYVIANNGEHYLYSNNNLRLTIANSVCTFGSNLVISGANNLSLGQENRFDINYDSVNTIGRIRVNNGGMTNALTVTTLGTVRVGIGQGIVQANASSVLELSSTTLGFLPPRMTTAQRTGISLPAAGLVVYDITDNRHYGYNGTTWNAFY